MILETMGTRSDYNANHFLELSPSRDGLRVHVSSEDTILGGTHNTCELFTMGSLSTLDGRHRLVIGSQESGATAFLRGVSYGVCASVRGEISWSDVDDIVVVRAEFVLGEHPGTLRFSGAMAVREMTQEGIDIFHLWLRRCEGP